MEDRIRELMNISDIYGVKAEFNCTDTCYRNSGFSAIDEIWMTPHDDIDNLTAGFFHELAHCVYPKISKGAELPDTSFSILSYEATCWELGFKLAKKHGYEWHFSSPVYSYAYKCLFSYVFGEGDDWLRIFIDLKEIQDQLDTWIKRR